MNFPYRVRSLASAEQPTSWANRSAVASGVGSYERAPDASHPAGRPGYVCCMDVFLPNYPAPVRPALSAAPGLFGGVPVFPSRASGDPAPVRSTGLFPPSTPPAVGPCQHSIGPAGAFWDDAP